MIEDKICINSDIAIYKRVFINEGVVIRSGAVFGSPAFKYKRGDEKNLPLFI